MEMAGENHHSFPLFCLFKGPPLSDLRVPAASDCPEIMFTCHEGKRDGPSRGTPNIHMGGGGVKGYTVYISTG